MIIKLTTKCYIHDDSFETVRFYEKGEVRHSIPTGRVIETFNESTLIATFKRQMPIRLVGAEADEAFANWKAYADKEKR